MLPSRLSQWFSSRRASRGRSAMSSAASGCAGLDQAQEVERAIERARLAVRRDDGRRKPADLRRANDVALIAGRASASVQPSAATSGDADGVPTITAPAASGHRLAARRAEQSRQSRDQLRGNHVARRRLEAARRWADRARDRRRGGSRRAAADSGARGRIRSRRDAPRRAWAIATRDPSDDERTQTSACSSHTPRSRERGRTKLVRGVRRAAAASRGPCDRTAAPAAPGRRG